MKASTTKKNSSGGGSSEKPTDPDKPVDPDDPDKPVDPDKPDDPEKPTEPGIHRATNDDSNKKELSKYTWLIIPLAILGLFVVIIIVNLVGKAKK